MTEEEFVRANWEWVYVRLAKPFEGVVEGEWIARLPLLPFSWCGFETEANAWAAAAAFTRERLEQIRQLKEDIDRHAPMQRIPLERIANAIKASFWDEWIVDDVRELCSASRILSRLESALTDLRKGMKA